MIICNQDRTQLLFPDVPTFRRIPKEGLTAESVTIKTIANGFTVNIKQKDCSNNFKTFKVCNAEVSQN